MSAPECTCIVELPSGYFTYCPLHLAASTLFDALKAAEWAGERQGGITCPSCAADGPGSTVFPQEEHTDTCQLAAALQSALGDTNDK